MAAIDKFYGRPIAKPLSSGVSYKGKQIQRGRPANTMANATTLRAAWNQQHYSYLLQLIEDIVAIAPQLRAHLMAEFDEIDWENTYYAGGPVDFESWLVSLRMQVNGDY